MAIHEPFTPTRRDFVKGVGGLLVAISLPVYLDLRQASAATITPPGSFGPATVPADQLASWLAVGRDGAVHVLTGKVELGTGTITASRQIVAEELDVAFDRIDIVQGITGESVDQGYTAGSQTIRTQWASGLRIAAASARQTLLSMAATRLGVATTDLTVKNGVVSGGGKTVSYADLVGGAKLPGTVSQQVKTKPSSSYRVVGQPLHREDIPDKIFGQFTFVQDVRIPGMLHARVVRPARPAPLQAKGTAIAQIIQGTLANASLVNADESSVKNLPGFVKLVVKDNFVAVVAEREEQAIAAAQALEVTWKDSASLPDQAGLYQAIQSARIGSTRVIQNSGDVDGALGSAAKVLQATYTHPYQAHASIGPSAAVATVHDGVAELWSPTQGVYQLRGAVATALGLQPQQVRVNYVEGSGCYGINGADDASLSAAIISQAIGKPVRVQYMRADEISWENYGTPMVMNLRAGLDATGKIVGWDYHGWTANRGGRPGPPGSVPAGMLAGFPESPPPPSPPPSPPLGDDGLNSTPWYAFANERVISYGVYSPWLFTGPLRSPSRLQNTFATESFMDELATAAGADPIAFRLAHTTDARLAAVINRVATAANWQARQSPAPAQGGTTRTGRGIAAVRYEGNSAWVAAIITLTVDTTTGAIAVTQVAVAHDCGVIVNPDGLRNQVEGNIVQGLSRSLKEEVKFDRSGVLGVDWASYPIITFTELPDDVRIELIDHPDLPALGAGESTISVIAGAMGNAIFDATGKRIRTLPFTPDRVKAALAT
ncbi:MAG TPA: molybdopterin cofactor-binding domain-containing protein [Terriglobales bacterium]|nr:molybdopterin cofactor-binding domain-containing protein [Terriglobales bacterium]